MENGQPEQRTETQEDAGIHEGNKAGRIQGRIWEKDTDTVDIIKKKRKAVMKQKASNRK